MHRVEYRHMKETDLDAICQLLNRCLDYDRIPREWILHKITGDPDYEPELAWVAVQGSDVVAIAQGIQRTLGNDPHGCIKMVAVDPDHRGVGIASCLLDRIETELARRQVEIRALFSRPNYFLPGIDPRYTPAVSFFLSRRYERTGDGFNMTVDLSAGSPMGFLMRRFQEDGENNPDNVRIIRPGLHEEDRIRRWLDGTGVSFSWHYQALHAFHLQSRHSSKRSGLLIAETESEWIGFAAYDAVLPGWFGPEWVRTDYRGRGIGKSLLFAALKAMVDDGYDQAEIGLVEPLPFYAKAAGATVSRTWWFFRKRFA